MVHDASQKEHQRVLVTRSVDAILIPEGVPETLEVGTPAILTQSLGGNYTIQLLTDNRKFRISGADGDAIGKPKIEAEVEAISGEPLAPEAAKELAWKLLKKVHDPEIPVNIIDLGLVYELDVHKRGDGLLLAYCKMTLTAPGCGMGDFLIQDVERQLKSIPGVASVKCEITFNPVWNPNTMMSRGAKLKLGLL